MATIQEEEIKRKEKQQENIKGMPIVARTDILKNRSFFKWLEDFKFQKDAFSNISPEEVKVYCDNEIQRLEKMGRTDYAWIVRLSQTDSGLMRKSGNIVNMESDLLQMEFANKGYISALYYAVSISSCLYKGDPKALEMAEKFVAKGIMLVHGLQPTLDHTNRFWRYCGMYYDKRAVIAINSPIKHTQKALASRGAARKCFHTAMKHAEASDEVQYFSDHNVVQRALQFHYFINLMHKLAYVAFLQCTHNEHVQDFVTVQDLEEAQKFVALLEANPAMHKTERTKFMLLKSKLVLAYRWLEMRLVNNIQSSDRYNLASNQDNARSCDVSTLKTTIQEGLKELHVFLNNPIFSQNEESANEINVLQDKCHDILRKIKVIEPRPVGQRRKQKERRQEERAQSSSAKESSADDDHVQSTMDNDSGGGVNQQEMDELVADMLAAQVDLLELEGPGQAGDRRPHGVVGEDDDTDPVDLTSSADSTILKSFSVLSDVGSDPSSDAI